MKVFPTFNKAVGAKLLRFDLESVGIPYEDSAGRVVDFHGLRHTFIIQLNQAGVPPKVIQALARHSTISLTMDNYTHLELHDQRGALEKLPNVPAFSPDKKEKGQAVALKTGTDDLSCPFGKAV